MISELLFILLFGTESSSNCILANNYMYPGIVVGSTSICASLIVILLIWGRISGIFSLGVCLTAIGALVSVVLLMYGQFQL